MADSELLNRADVTILNGDFELTANEMREGLNFFYFDPPYRPLNATSSFNSYAKEEFNDDEQIRLRDFCTRLNEQPNVRWMLSNADCSAKNPNDTFFEDIYADFQIHRVYASRAINANPVGIGATLAMNDLYMEVAQEFVKTYRLLKVSIAKGGSENMMTGAERTEMLWELSDELARMNRKLRMLAISIAYHNLTDVWNQATAGIIPKSHSDIAHDALDRWKRASEVSRILDY